jgi:flagellar operon protein
MINPIGAGAASARVGPSPPSAQQSAPSSSFADVLGQQMESAGRVKFSAHAQRRLDSREITLTGNDRVRLDNAVNQLAQKGSKESLVLMDQMALLVSVPNRTVITVVPQSEAGSSVFTHIDSAVVLPKDSSASA